MDLQQLEKIIATLEIDNAKKLFEVNRDIDKVLKSIRQYDPKTHDVHDKTKRKDKRLDNGNFVDVSRLSLALQKKIVLLAASFLGNPTLECTPNNDVEEQMLQAHLDTWEDNKLDYKFKKTTKKVMSELECAELWYVQKSDDGFKMRMRLLHNSYDPTNRTGGDKLYPVFDIYGDMIAFGRGYEVKEEDKVIEYFDIYTAKYFYYLKKVDGVWGFVNADPTETMDANGKEVTVSTAKSVPNPFGKIPVIYGSQPLAEWDDVQELIERLEKKTSNHADTNDRFDSPIMFTEGEVDGFDLQKDDTGKLLEGRDGAKVSYITWDSAPESMRMEIENLWKYIHTLTHTPDISFEQMKSIGAVSGIALKLMFMDAHMKAADKEEIFGEFVQRRINFLKTALSVINPALKPAIKLKIKPKFEYFLPKDDVELVNTLVTAVAGGIMSKQSAVKQNPKVEDGESEYELVKEENEAAQKAMGLDAVMNE